MLGWDVVLSGVACMRLPIGKMIDLYEQIVIEMVEMREIDTARALMKGATVSQLLTPQKPHRTQHIHPAPNLT
jgi:WD40 repeat-containing protein SMU1